MSESSVFSQSETNLKAEITKYLRKWYWFLLGIAICLFLAFLYLRYTTPIYQASAELLVKDNKKGGVPDGMASTFEDLDIFSGAKNVDNEIRVLKSKSLLKRALKNLPDLQPSQFVQGNIRTIESYGKDKPFIVNIDTLYQDSLAKAGLLKVAVKKDLSSFSLTIEDAKPISYKFGDKIQTSFGIFSLIPNPHYAFGNTDILLKFNNIDRYAASYINNISISVSDQQSSTIIITAKDPVPQKAIDIINTLIQVYNQDAIDDKNIISRNTIAFIDDRLRTLVGELSGVEKRVSDFKEKNALTDINSDIDQYFTHTKDLYQKLEQAKLQSSVLSSLLSYINSPENANTIVPTSLGIQDPTLNSLISAFNELQLKRQQSLTTIESNNIIIQNLDKSIQNVRKSIVENIRTLQRGVSLTQQQVNNDYSQFQLKIKTVPDVERQLLEIQREQGIKQSIYQYLLQKREESLISLAATVSNSRIIDDTTAKGKPVSPNPSIIYLAAFLIGIILPFCSIYIIDILNDKVQLQRDILSRTNVPILGEIMHAKTEDELVVKENTRSPISEMFRLVRSNLKFATSGKEDKVILVTSSMSGEGKTFFCTNLGASIALSGKKVVMLEFDLRKPKLLRGLGLHSKNGISNFVINESLGIKDLVQPVADVSGLDVIGAGPTPPNPSELLLSERIALLIQELKKEYDHVIIDSPPVGQVSDAFTLGAYAQISAYVVRYNYTFKEQLNIVQDIYSNQKLNHLMIILNDAKPKNSYGYGYGSNNDQRSSLLKRIQSLFRR